MSESADATIELADVGFSSLTFSTLQVILTNQSKNYKVNAKFRRDIAISHWPKRKGIETVSSWYMENVETISTFGHFITGRYPPS